MGAHLALTIASRGARITSTSTSTTTTAAASRRQRQVICFARRHA
ncbi:MULTISPECIES: hypothetical protein [unclassified Bradyrhizobium]